MAKRRSLLQMATDITERTADKLTKQLELRTAGGHFELGRDGGLETLFDNWLERVGKLDDDQLRSMELGAWVEIDGIQYLATDLLIVREWTRKDWARVLVRSHDDRRTSNIPVIKLWQPALFDKLDYAVVREKWVVLGEGARVRVGPCGDDGWLLYHAEGRRNKEAQDRAWQEREEAESYRLELRRAHPECQSTDQIMQKLGRW